MNLPVACEHDYRWLRTETSYQEQSGLVSMDVFYCTRCLEYRRKLRTDIGADDTVTTNEASE